MAPIINNFIYVNWAVWDISVTNKVLKLFSIDLKIELVKLKDTQIYLLTTGEEQILSQ